MLVGTKLFLNEVQKKAFSGGSCEGQVYCWKRVPKPGNGTCWCEHFLLPDLVSVEQN